MLGESGEDQSNVCPTGRLCMLLFLYCFLFIIRRKAKAAAVQHWQSGSFHPPLTLSVEDSDFGNFIRNVVWGQKGLSSGISL